jgi:hypothetical protein
MNDIFDYMDIPDYDLDIDGNGIPDVHEPTFVQHPDGTPGIPGVIDGNIDKDGDGIPDQHDGHIDLDGNGLDYRTYVDSGGDGQNDWIDPYSSLPGQGLDPELAAKLAIEAANPFFT